MLHGVYIFLGVKKYLGDVSAHVRVSFPLNFIFNLIYISATMSKGTYVTGPF